MTLRRLTGVCSRYLLVLAAAWLGACGAKTEFEVDAGLVDTGDGEFPRGATRSFSGSLDENQVWERPVSCSSLSLSPGDYFYSVHRFTNTTDETIELRIDASYESRLDGYLFAYNTPFQADAPLDRCVGADDDYEGIQQSRIEGVLVWSGASINIVVSSFGPQTTGSYDLVVTRTL